MAHKIVMRLVFALFVFGIIGAIFVFRSSLIPKNLIPQKNTRGESIPNPSPIKKVSPVNEKKVSTDRITELEDQIAGLEAELEDQDKGLKKLSDKLSSQSVPTNTNAGNKSIISTAYTQGSQFTTSSSIYSPMGMYVNVTCPEKCILWIHFYTTSKNTASPNSAQGYSHLFGLFINDQENSIYTQGSFPIANASFPSSLNAAIPVGAGTHTIDIRAKTTGGTLSVEKSFLQVIAIEE